MQNKNRFSRSKGKENHKFLEDHGMSNFIDTCTKINFCNHLDFI